MPAAPSLSACFDVVPGRPSINLNYHYGAMGLSGSWSSAAWCPLRPASGAAEQLLTDRLPISPMAAQRLGLVDGIGPDNPADFDLGQAGRDTARRPAPRPADGRHHPYRRRELTDMWHDIFEDRHGFEANRRRFLGLGA